jgi:ADP-ribose diphosphatase
MKLFNSDKPLPTIHSRKMVAKSNLFRVESVELEFSNGAVRNFERMAGSGRGAVMIVPFLDEQTIILIREYAAGTHSYQLGFPKGLIDPGEDVLQAANRELQEEVGYAANELEILHSMNLAPGFFNASMQVVIARDLYEQSLEGDEPEPLEVIHWPLHKVDALLSREDFTESRSIAALLLTQRWLGKL